mgnify:CR=1 FL=1
MSTKEAKHINELKDLIGFKSVIIDLGSYENPELGIDFTLYYYITPNGRVLKLLSGSSLWEDLHDIDDVDVNIIRRIVKTLEYLVKRIKEYYNIQ